MSSTPQDVSEQKVGKSLGQKLVTAFASIFILYHLFYISQILVITSGVAITSIPMHLGIHLAGTLGLTFLLVRARKGTGKLPFYDLLLALPAIGIPFYYGLFFESEIVYGVAAGAYRYAILGIILSLLILEACRRLLGVTYTSVVAFFFVLPLICGYLPGILNSPNQSILRWGEFLFASYAGIFGTPLEISAHIVIIYLFFSQLLIHSGAGEFFINLSYAAMGSVRGGPAKMAVVASGFFGMLSGSPAGNVAATGTFTIPMMKRIGYPAYYAGAVECVASLGGMFMPPVMGAVVFLLADFIEMPYIQVCKHAFIPACLYYFALFIFIDQEAVRRRLQGLPRETLPPFWRTLKGGLWYGIPVFVLVYLLAVMHYSPEKACIWAAASLFLLSMFTKKTRLGPAKLVMSADGTLQALLQVAVAVAAAGIIVGAVTITGIQLGISRELVRIAAGSVPALLLLAGATSFIMGMGVGIIGSYVFLALMVAPALISAGVPDIAAHLFLFYFAMLSFITPPLAILAYVTSAFAGAHPFKIGWQATRLGILAYVLPFVWVFSPALIAIGTPVEIVTVIIKVIIGIIGLAFGIGGYFKGELNWLQRLLCIAGSFLLLFGTSIPFVAGGAAILGIAILWQWLKRRVVGQPPGSESTAT